MKQKNTPTPETIKLKGVGRALEVLEYIAVNRGRATDIAEALDISWATLYRTLKQLELGGFLCKDEDTNQYSVGRRMWLIGSTYVADHAALEIAVPYIKQATTLKNITIQYVEKSIDQTTVLYSMHSGEPITKANFGHSFPLHTGSKGLVLLAYSSDTFINEYLSHPLNKLTKNTEVDPEKLRKSISQIKEDGYAITISDVQLFTGSVSAPIYNAKGDVIACICMVARKSLLTNETQLELLLEALLNATQGISLALGWRPQSSFVSQHA